MYGWLILPRNYHAIHYSSCRDVDFDLFLHAHALMRKRHAAIFFVFCPWAFGWLGCSISSVLPVRTVDLMRLNMYCEALLVDRTREREKKRCLPIEEQAENQQWHSSRYRNTRDDTSLDLFHPMPKCFPLNDQEQEKRTHTRFTPVDAHVHVYTYVSPLGGPLSLTKPTIHQLKCMTRHTPTRSLPSFPSFLLPPQRSALLCFSHAPPKNPSGQPESTARHHRRHRDPAQKLYHIFPLSVLIYDTFQKRDREREQI